MDWLKAGAADPGFVKLADGSYLRLGAIEYLDVKGTPEGWLVIAQDARGRAFTIKAEADEASAREVLDKLVLAIEG